jgi:rfaE bifunctional protein nucleotidyltransferase chain/domain
MFAAKKSIPIDKLADSRAALKELGKTLVLTNGCFDLLHAGHIYALEHAARYGDVLWVGINSDASVKGLKGPKRPIYSQEERLYILSALECVQGVFIFDGNDLAQEIQLIKPNVYVKSGDYSLEKLNPKERSLLEACNAKIVFTPFLPGKSTTQTLEALL